MIYGESLTGIGSYYNLYNGNVPSHYPTLKIENIKDEYMSVQEDGKL